MRTLDLTKLDARKAEKMVDLLQQLLADFQIFYSNLRGFHWKIKGSNFFTLHAKFEDMYNDTAEKVDEIAERILMLGGTPASQFSEYLKVAKIKEAGGMSSGDEVTKNILETFAYLIGEERKLLGAAAEADDEVTVAMMSDYLQEQEKMVWMLTAYMSK